MAWNVTGNIQGPAGPEGDQGPQGPQGIQGPVGLGTGLERPVFVFFLQRHQPVLAGVAGAHRGGVFVVCVFGGRTVGLAVAASN